MIEPQKGLKSVPAVPFAHAQTRIGTRVRALCMHLPERRRVYRPLAASKMIYIYGENMVEYCA